MYVWDGRLCSTMQQLQEATSVASDLEARVATEQALIEGVNAAREGVLRRKRYGLPFLESFSALQGSRCF
jgi:hypothetical protein